MMGPIYPATGSTLLHPMHGISSNMLSTRFHTPECCDVAMALVLLYFLLQFSYLVPPSSATSDRDVSSSTSIIFTTLGRSYYAFDIFTLPAHGVTSAADEIQITDGQSVNFNGYFPSPSSNPTLFSLLLNQTRFLRERLDVELVYVTERNGISKIFYDAIFRGAPRRARRSEFEIPHRLQIPLLGGEQNKNWVSFKDRPSVSGDYLVYVSTNEDPGMPRTSWAAVYSTNLKSGLTRRLTPYGVADFSPSVSPSGVWTAVASYGGKGWDGEVEELSTDIYVFLTRDGTRRVKVIQHGGWPCWVDDSTLYFHRRGLDEWLSIYRAILPSHGTISTESVVIERVTPPGLHAFTPATSPGNNFIAVATRRPDSSFRHIELFNLVTGEFKELTRAVSPNSHHFNPFISSDATRIGYHKCRGERNGRKSEHLLLENIRSPVPDLSLFRFDGSFPSFSPAGDRIAFVNFPGLYVVSRDGSNRREVFSKAAFSTAWDRVRKGVVYTSAGPDFASESTQVDIISINVDDSDEENFKRLTTDGKNNAFPWPSPDGKWVVFRSGRSGHKNLYIMDAVDGESKEIRRLTEGPWTDTMCNWSPDGDWIAFSSDRDSPGSGSFDIFVIHPNGTGLRKLFQSGSAGRANHPSFSPDGRFLVFTTDYAGISAEPISNPHHYQPYGEIFTIKLDGSNLQRLTHNSYEDGTPAWSPRYIKPVNVERSGDLVFCGFEDCHWLNENPNNDIGPLTKPQCSPLLYPLSPKPKSVYRMLQRA